MDAFLQYAKWDLSSDAIPPQLALMNDAVKGRKLVAVTAIGKSTDIFTEKCVLYASRDSESKIAQMVALEVRESKMERKPVNFSHRVLKHLHTGKAFPGGLEVALNVAAQLSPVCRPSSSEERPSVTELFKIFTSNGISACFDPKGRPLLTVLALLCSLLNHSCSPNTSWVSSWDAEEACPVFTVFATRDIEEGEELTVSYIKPDRLSLPKEKRIQWLRTHYGDFTCTCSRCSIAGDDVVAFRCSNAACGGRHMADAPQCSGCGTLLLADAGAVQNAVSSRASIVATPITSSEQVDAAAALLHRSDPGYAKWLRAAMPVKYGAEPALAPALLSAICARVAECYENVGEWRGLADTVHAIVGAADAMGAVGTPNGALYGKAVALVRGAPRVFPAGWLPHFVECEMNPPVGIEAVGEAQQAHADMKRDHEKQKSAGFDGKVHLAVK